MANPQTTNPSRKPDPKRAVREEPPREKAPARADDGTRPKDHDEKWNEHVSEGGPRLPSTTNEGGAANATTEADARNDESVRAAPEKSSAKSGVQKTSKDAASKKRNAAHEAKLDEASDAADDVSNSVAPSDDEHEGQRDPTNQDDPTELNARFAGEPPAR